MSRSISTELKQTIGSESQTTCTCLRVIRKDGTKLGFTTCDVSFDYEFITNPDDFGTISYSPIASYKPSAIRSTETTGVDNLELVGIFSADAITERDLIGGLYDDAQVTIFTVDYNVLAHGEFIKLDGYVGECSKMDGIYKVEVLSKETRLKKYIGIVTSATCRVKDFCNGQCKLDAADYTFSREIGSVTDALNFVFEDSHVTGYYSFGKMTFTSGQNVGISREIKDHVKLVDDAKVLLKESFPFPVDEGDEIQVMMGCSRLFTFCQLLGNANNFRGEPHLPGNAITTRIGKPPVKH